jgi:hypothetical protein
MDNIKADTQLTWLDLATSAGNTHWRLAAFHLQDMAALLIFLIIDGHDAFSGTQSVAQFEPS